ncbi:MAG: hypothetical protein KIT08_00685 [Anaerolineales bacterium]|nr:MAG: hypothetical protein KIT08_00685 [Anaerolineales bacterium]
MPKTRLEVDVKLKPSPYDCPLCEKPFDVQKVSAILASGTAHSSTRSTSSGTTDIYSEPGGNRLSTGYLHSSTQSASFSQSRLAELLAPAEPPKGPNRKEFDEVGSTIGCLFLPFWGVSAYLLSRASEDWAGSILCAGPVLGLLVAVLAANLIHSKDEPEKKYQQAMDEHKKILSEYENAYEKWNQLYFCHKHDIVFVAGSKDYAGSNEAWDACLDWGRAASTS